MKLMVVEWTWSIHHSGNGTHKLNLNENIRLFQIKFKIDFIFLILEKRGGDWRGQKVQVDERAPVSLCKPNPFDISSCEVNANDTANSTLRDG